VHVFSRRCNDWRTTDRRPLAAPLGRIPWYCAPCVKAKDVERVQSRNVADRAKRRTLHDPLCRDCRRPLMFDYALTQTEQVFEADGGTRH
jgi:hypothetical protein